MLCYHCGHEVVEGSIFCSSCRKLRDPIEVLRQRTSMFTGKKNENSNTTHLIPYKGKIIVVGIIILSIIIHFIRSVVR
jgi:hypothetical protein